MAERNNEAKDDFEALGANPPLEALLEVLNKHEPESLFNLPDFYYTAHKLATAKLTTQGTTVQFIKYIKDFNQ